MKRVITSSLNNNSAVEVAHISIEYISVSSYISSIFGAESTGFEDTIQKVIEESIVVNFSGWIEACERMIEAAGCIVDQSVKSPFEVDSEQETQYILFHHPEITTKQFAVGVDVRLTDHDLTKEENGVIVKDVKRISKNQRYHAKEGQKLLEAKLNTIVDMVNPEEVKIDDQSVESFYEGMSKLKTILVAYVNAVLNSPNR